MASRAILSILVLLAVQAYFCAAFNNQQTGWVTTHLKRPHSSHLHTGRHLGETPKEETVTTTGKGWRANLIVTSAYLGTENYTILQKVHRDVDASIARGKSLDRKARNAPYHNHKGRRMLDFTSDIEATPGSYSMEISLGTPPQNFIAIADTGSDLVWLQCSTCEVCFNATLFDPALSSTYTPLGCTGCAVLGGNELLCTPNCQYTYRYGDQSTTQGDFSLETLTLQNTDGTSTAINNFQFGCGLRNQGSFTGTDGLVGLARGPISFPSQIAPFLNNVNKFSYCLLGRYDADSARSPLLFGESAVPANVSGTLFTPQLTPYEPSVIPYYYVNLLDVTVGSQALNIPASAFAIDANGNGGFIFDSGTTYTLLNTVAYRSVVDTFVAQLGSTYPRVDFLDLTGLEVCYDISTAQTVSIPNMVFNFEAADFDLPFENIMLLFTTTGTDTVMCLALLESTGISIFGNVQQQNFQVLYDEDNLQIGWVPADCQNL
ncbi:hypothetical protein MPTK1_6g05980 [Marchantia polymorpha subsp. ruderalis]|uniref:Peptidase A1 domain-containing protein n=2 Tax=Marchantia polymorpha TaxID=3197 RepID=A0AAF6BP10_MARPO|nr:hypothetical protein MARPO_0097s0046 [Marchantia polymorpha]BBN13744.1 hypothetical protein Mp_6g05980 [Marchantia polymorpha subsp. ruderalis]|eukprot:PTQ32568.1 hypothetical protein MARPO_0097s0046 [Marchantia polymorpha]